MRFSMPFQKTFNARQLLLELWQQRRQRFAITRLARLFHCEAQLAQRQRAHRAGRGLELVRQCTGSRCLSRRAGGAQLRRYLGRAEAEVMQEFANHLIVIADLSLERIHVNLQKYRNRLCG